VSFDRLFPIRILQWPESLKVELHEEGGTLAHHLVAEIYIPFPSRWGIHFCFGNITSVFLYFFNKVHKLMRKSCMSVWRFLR
jgi:hypothetical protein